MMTPQKPMHGMAKAKGCSHMRLGNFCEMFPKEPSWADDCGFTAQCEVEKVAAALGGANGLMHDALDESRDSGIPAAYTFFAQFIDHDITLDTTTKLHGPQLDEHEVAALANLRSASLDLDCVYGFGPDVMPFMFDQTQPGRMLVGNKWNANDLPRNSDKRALIGDPRNDENMFVSQIQLAFLKFHNKRIVGRSYKDAVDDCRFHYQYLVWEDFLKRICDPTIYNFANSRIKDPAQEYPLCDIRDHCKRICMPVEFSVAAYRFGHTLVRSQYPANAQYPVIELFDERFGTEGFSEVPEKLTVDWRFLLDVEPCHSYVNSKAIDHLLTDELIRMPNPIVGKFAPENDRSLAFRNLLRGYALGLPSGQRVAQALLDKGYTDINPGQDLKFDEISGWECLDCNLAEKLAEHTPLFFYLMREGGVVGGGERLGPVGSAILLEVFGTMLVYCKSYLNEDNWLPDPCVSGGSPFTLADLIRYVNK